MDSTSILAELRAERDRIDQAIAAIEGLNSTGNHTARRGRPPAITAQAAPKQARVGRRISAAGRKRIAEAARAMWARRKKAAAATKIMGTKKAAPAKKSAAKKVAPARHMSTATRKRLSELAKARWAARKAAAKTA